jgi:sugar O-acyltransferase (sialic acid O-acetyltransferase NeuD family)
MKEEIFGIYGASGFGREVMPIARQQIQSSNTSLVFIDDNPTVESLNGHPVFCYRDFLKLKAVKKTSVIAIADPSKRQLVQNKLVLDGIDVGSVRSPTSVVMDNVSIGAGSIISPFVTLTSDILIGEGFHANIYSYVAHDCVIGDFVTFAPGVKCNGNVFIGDGVYIGAGAIIKQGRPGEPLIIGKGAVIAMGTVVRKNVEDGALVFGDRSRSVSRKRVGE